MLRRTALLVTLGLACAAPAARAADHVPGEVVVRMAPDAPQAVAANMAVKEDVAPRTKVVQIRDGRTVREAIHDLERRPGVERATPNVIAHTAYVPNDPGRGTAAGGWESLQWNFAGPFGVNAPAAWDNLRAAGHDGGERRRRRRARHRRRLHRPRRLPALARPAPRDVRRRARLRRRRPLPDRSQRPRHACRLHDRRGDRQRRRRHRARLRRADHARTRARRGRLRATPSRSRAASAGRSRTEPR